MTHRRACCRPRPVFLLMFFETSGLAPLNDTPLIARVHLAFKPGLSRNETSSFSGFGASRKSWCQERAPAAPVLPPDYILPKTYLRVGLPARVSPSGPFCVASRRYGLVSVSELFWKQAESRDRSYRVVAGPSHGFWGRYLVVLDCSGGTSTIHGRPGTVISIRGISTPRRRQRMEIPRIAIWSVKS